MGGPWRCDKGNSTQSNSADQDDKDSFSRAYLHHGASRFRLVAILPSKGKIHAPKCLPIKARNPTVRTKTRQQPGEIRVELSEVTTDVILHCGFCFPPARSIRLPRDVLNAPQA